ncbi:MAG TPA: helix-turn-helix transcriptional regulator [Actinomycetota bacterium]|jgi:molybdopterin-binding protein|nr:helix-turn-helix transcriptional regulator [Actinomycetota bacterium]
MEASYRIGEAAELLGVRVETLRRWERQGKLQTRRTEGGQRRVPAEEVARLLGERRERPRVTSASVRNRFPGIVTHVETDGVAATVELLAGPHRILALITREAVEEIGLSPGMAAVATVKATNVMIEVDR